MLENGITKEHSQIIYGIAILFMIYYHLFAFPERVPECLKIVNYLGSNLTLIIAQFGHICISLYAFMSGYGMTRKVEIKQVCSTYDIYCLCLQQIKNFYLKFLPVFFVFVTYGIISKRYEFKFIDYILSIVGYYSVYNKEWWYVKQYIAMQLLFPLIYKFWKRVNRCFSKNIRLLIYVIFLVTSSAIVSIMDPFSGYTTFIVCVLEFTAGCIIAMNKIYERVKINNNVIPVLGIMVVFILRTYFLYYGTYDYILAPIFIYCVCRISQNQFVRKYFDKTIRLCGKYSIYMWLTHTFYIYYYFQDFFFFLNISTIIYIETIVICIITAKCFDYFYVKHICNR